MEVFLHFSIQKFSNTVLSVTALEKHHNMDQCHLQKAAIYLSIHISAFQSKVQHCSLFVKLLSEKLQLSTTIKALESEVTYLLQKESFLHVHLFYSAAVLQ